MIEYDPQFQHRPPGLGHAGFRARHGHVHLLTQLAPYQRVQIFGDDRPDRDRDSLQRAARPALPDCGTSAAQASPRRSCFDVCDQYTLQGDLFAQAILDDTPVPTPLEDAVANMRVIDALVTSAQTSAWVTIP